MDSRHSKARMDVEGDDRLSSLPDDLIHKILSFNDIKEAIQTSVLSTRWRHTWTSIPCLNFESNSFRTLNQFSKFVKHVLANRNNQIEVSSVKLHFRGKVSQVFVKRVLEYAFSHNVQQMDISCLLPKKIDIPLSLFCSRSVKHLTLYGFVSEDFIMTPSTWELQALTTLNLDFVTLNDDSTDTRVGFFSNCPNLKNLTLRHCRINSFNICHPGLSSLTLEDGCKGVIVNAPQLKNLAIIHCSGIHLVSAPNLSSLQYEVSHPLEISSDLPLLEKADICISYISSEDMATARKIVCMLQHLHSVQFLTLNLELVELLSSSVELSAHQPSPFANLKSLKVCPADDPYDLFIRRKSRKKQRQSKVTMSTEVRNFLLDSSPGATFTMVSHEEFKAVKNARLARNLMTHLQEKLKKITETNMTGIEQDKAPVATMRQQLEDVKHTISMWERINALLKEAPTSHREKLQARFFGLSAEVKTIFEQTTGWMDIQSDKKVHEPATSSQLSS